MRGSLAAYGIELGPVLERAIEKEGRTAAEIGLDVLGNPLEPLGQGLIASRPDLHAGADEPTAARADLAAAVADLQVRGRELAEANAEANRLQLEVERRGGGICHTSREGAMKTDIEIVGRCTRATRGGELVVALVSGMVTRHRWRHVEDPADRSRHLCLIGADTAAEARELLVAVPAWQRPNTLLVGVEGELFQVGRREPRPGTIGELLETFGLAGYLPAGCLTDWRPLLSGFAGRKDLMPRIGTNCFKASQSENYCDWVHSPGRDVFEFLAALAGVLGPAGMSP